MKEMIKRKDGSYSQRGLWDNIRANRGSGKAPTKEMLEQERKIRAKAAYGMEVPDMNIGGYFPRFMQDGGEPDGPMALSQMAAVIDKLSKLRQFINEDSDLEPWVSSKLAVMDHYADAVHDYMMYGGEDEEEEDAPMTEIEMEEMKNGGIPQRYRNQGFTKVGVKRKSTRPGKKWMVLAKKGDKYKIVHGGYKGMQDYTQHRNKKRQKNFWNRMGGKSSSKATDPFSPLYWHKRFGTWEDGGEIPMYQSGGRLSESVGADAQKIGKCGLERNEGKYKPDVLVDVPATKQELYPSKYKSLYSVLPSDKKERKAVIAAFEALKSAGTSPYVKDYTPEDYQAALYEANIYNNNMRQAGYEKYFDPSTGAVLPQYATSYSNPTMAYYRSRFPQSKQITAEQIINLMPLEERKALISRGYRMPQQKYGGMPCYECGGQYQNGGHYNLDGEWVRSKGSGTFSGNAYYKNGGSSTDEYISNNLNTNQMNPLYDFIKRAQMGGEQQSQNEQIMQLIQAYAQMQGVDPQQIMAQLQQMTGPEQQQAVQQMMQAVQNQNQETTNFTNPMMAYGGEMGGPVMLPALPTDVYGMPTYGGGGAYLNPYTDAMMEMQDGGKPEWLIRAQLKAQGYSGSALENKLDQMRQGGIHINPANKGKFTKKAKAAGMGVQAFANKVLGAPEGKYSAATRKQANFARNAAGWKKQLGGLAEGDILENVDEDTINELIRLGYQIERM